MVDELNNHPAPNPPRHTTLGAHFDPLGEYEFPNTVYTLTVRVPRRPVTKWLPSFVSRTPVIYAKSSSQTYSIKPDDTNPNLDCFELKHLNDDDMDSKKIKIKAALLPEEVRCKHLKASRVCNEKCYVLEKGGSISRKKCSRDDCQGHVYGSAVVEDAQRRVCFGNKGARVVYPI